MNAVNAGRKPRIDAVGASMNGIVAEIDRLKLGKAIKSYVRFSPRASLRNRNSKKRARKRN